MEQNNMENQESNNNRRNGDTKIGLTLRIVVAVYVLYLAYQLIQGYGDTSGNDRILIAIAIIAFIAAGGAILFFSGRKLIRKEYIDADESTENEITAEVETKGGEPGADGEPNGTDGSGETAENEER